MAGRAAEGCRGMRLQAVNVWANDKFIMAVQAVYRVVDAAGVPAQARRGVCSYASEREPALGARRAGPPEARPRCSRPSTATA